jgi:enoyl-CoA hydratase
MTVETIAYETIVYGTAERIAFITLNRPDKLNTIKPPMPEELQHAIARANGDDAVRVIVLQAAGRAFCAGFDFSEDLDHFSGWGAKPGSERWDPGQDLMAVTNPFSGPVPQLMSIWRSPKPVIARVHGWCVGGGSDMVLLSDIVIAAEDARFGTPYARVWGCYLTGMWLYRLGLTRVKSLALTGDAISGREAARLGLINAAVPAELLDQEVRRIAGRMARIPSSQLAAMKLVINQAYENMGLQTTQWMGWILDGYMRNTPEGLRFVQTAGDSGVAAAVSERDAPFGDYSHAPQSEKPRGVP